MDWPPVISHAQSGFVGALGSSAGSDHNSSSSKTREILQRKEVIGNYGKQHDIVQSSKPAIRHSSVVLWVPTLLAVSLSGPSLVYTSTFALVSPGAVRVDALAPFVVLAVRVRVRVEVCFGASGILTARFAAGCDPVVLGLGAERSRGSSAASA